MTHKCKTHAYKHEYTRCQCGHEFCPHYWRSCPACWGTGDDNLTAQETYKREYIDPLPDVVVTAYQQQHAKAYKPQAYPDREITDAEKRRSGYAPLAGQGTSGCPEPRVVPLHYFTNEEMERIRLIWEKTKEDVRTIDREDV